MAGIWAKIISVLVFSMITPFPGWLLLWLKSPLIVSFQVSEVPHYLESIPLHVLSVLMLHLCPWTSIHHNPCPTIMKMSLIIFLAERPAICHSFLGTLPLNIHWMKSGWMSESTTAFSAITLPVFHIQTRNKIFLCISDVPTIPPPSSSDRLALSLSNHPIPPPLFWTFYIQNSIPSLSLSLPWTLL